MPLIVPTAVCIGCVMAVLMPFHTVDAVVLIVFHTFESAVFNVLKLVFTLPTTTASTVSTPYSRRFMTAWTLSAPSQRCRPVRTISPSRTSFCRALRSWNILNKNNEAVLTHCTLYHFDCRAHSLRQ